MEWIETAKQLPKKLEDVIVAVRYDTANSGTRRFVTVGYYYGPMGFAVEEVTYPIDQVPFWMPLPRHPEVTANRSERTVYD